MIVPLLFDIDLLLFCKLGIGEDEQLLPCRAVGLAKKDSWMYAITIWLDAGGNYNGIQE
jgi:hypothetical protein